MLRSVFYSGLIRKIAFWLRPVGCVSLLMLAITGAAAETSSAKFGPPGSWVKPQFFNQHASTSLADTGVDQYLLLQDRQINAAQDEVFFHSVQQILTPSGVQNGATLTMDFNPGYETLTVHWARIWRGTQHLDRLDTNNVKVVQREQDLDQFALNGKKSAILVLDDVRVGDIIDYAYSIKGENPVFGQHFSEGIPIQFSQPAERLRTRVLWPNSRRLYAKAHGSVVQPVAIAGKDSTEYIWDLQRIPGVTLEDSLPMWCDAEPWVQLSDFKTWAEVNQWAMALFQMSSPLSADLSRKIAEWKQLGSQEQQILAALRFVQDEVRYFGIEMGDSTEKPADPSKVFTRRFGDCKDKSLLFVTILRALGIEAYPVLVNATSGRAITDWQPSAAAFDHCIATVRYNDQMYWFDPTINYQRGSLALHYLPGYDCGLVIAPATTGLTAIPHPTGLSQTTTTEYFHMHGKTEGAELKVVTVAAGRDADSLRALFAGTKRSDIEKSYTHFYLDQYPGTRMSAPIAIVDDEWQNRIQTTESYSLDKPWVQSGVDKKYRFQFFPASISALLKKPVDIDRQLPLGISFPQHQVLRTEVVLPGYWQPEGDKKAIFDSAFSFRKSSHGAGGKFVIEYEYQSLTDAIAPDQVSQHLQHLDQVSQTLGHELTWR